MPAKRAFAYPLDPDFNATFPGGPLGGEEIIQSVFQSPAEVKAELQRRLKILLENEEEKSNE